MAEDDIPEGEAEKPKKKGLLIPLVIGVVLALGLGGGAFWALSAGPLSHLFASDKQGHAGEEAAEDHATETAIGQVAFIPLDVVTISLGAGANGRHLIFEAQLEVEAAYQAEVELLKPRVLDVLNSYLRVVEVAELSEPSSLLRLRAQMLHRAQIVTGEGRVRDLLVTQFVVN